MVYVIGFIIIILAVLFLPPPILIIGGLIMFFVPGFSLFEIIAIILGVIKAGGGN